MTPEEVEKTRRDYAEKIISGEYKAVVLLLLDEDNECQIFYEGGRFNAIGMMLDTGFGLINKENANDN